MLCAAALLGDERRLLAATGANDTHAQTTGDQKPKPSIDGDTNPFRRGIVPGIGITKGRTGSVSATTPLSARNTIFWADAQNWLITNTDFNLFAEITGAILTTSFSLSQHFGAGDQQKSEQKEDTQTHDVKLGRIVLKTAMGGSVN